MAEHHCENCKCIVHDGTCPHCGNAATLIPNSGESA